MAAVNQECINININIWTFKEIAKLSEKIKNQHGDPNCKSWRYPAKKSSEIDVYKLSENIEKCNDYTYVLELIIDRTIYNLNLIINYLENLEGMTQFHPCKNVQRPESLSLVAVLYLLWERVQALSNSNTQTHFKNLEIVDVSMKTSRFTQTELSKISRCACCDMVQKFMSQLIFDIEKILKNESVLIKESRNNVKDIVEDMSNWGAMSRWLNAITIDINKILEKNEKIIFENQRLKDLIHSNEQLHKNQLSELKEKNKILEELVKDKDLSIVAMKKQIEDLIDEKNADDNQAVFAMMRLKNVLSEKEETIKRLEEDKATLQKENDELLKTDSQKSEDADICARNLLVVMENEK